MTETMQRAQKSLMMAFGHVRHGGIFVCRGYVHRPTRSQTHTQTHTLVDSYSLFMGFKLYCENIN